MAINPYYRRKVRVQNLGFKSLEGVLQNEGTVRINLTDGAAFLYDSGQDFTSIALPSGVTGKGARRYKAYIYQGADVICGFCDVEGAGETLGADLAVNGTFAADTNWTKGTGWTIGTGVATKADGAASDLVATANIAGTRGQLYKVTVDIALTAGVLTVKAGSLVLGTITPDNDGSLTFYFTNDGTNFQPTFSADTVCAGTVDNVVVKAVTAAAANVSIKLFAAQVAGSQNIEGGLTSVPTNFDCSASDLTYKIVPLF